MKRVGTYNNIPVYTSPDVPDGIVYMYDERDIKLYVRRKKNGDPDMRYDVNRLYFRVLGHNDKDSRYFTQSS